MTRRIALCALLLPLSLALADGEAEKPAKPKPDAWKQAIADKMRRKVTLDFSGTPLKDVVQFMREVTGVDLYVDPGSKTGDVTVDLKVSNLAVESALKLILGLKKLESKLACGGVVIGTAKRLKVYPDALPKRPAADGGNPAHAEAYDALAGKKIALSFNGVPLGDVMSFIEAVSDAKIPVDKALMKPGTTITINARNLPLPHALQRIAAAIDGQLRFEGGQWSIAPLPRPAVKEGGAEDAEQAEEGEGEGAGDGGPDGD